MTVLPRLVAACAPCAFTPAALAQPLTAADRARIDATAPGDCRSSLGPPEPGATGR